MQQPVANRRYILQNLLAVVGGTRYLPSEEKIDGLANRITSAPHFRQSLTRCVAQKRAGRLLLWRETRHLPKATVRPGEVLLWDGRFWLQHDGRLPAYGPDNSGILQHCYSYVPPIA